MQSRLVSEGVSGAAMLSMISLERLESGGSDFSCPFKKGKRAGNEPVTVTAFWDIFPGADGVSCL